MNQGIYEIKQCELNNLLNAEMTIDYDDSDLQIDNGTIIQATDLIYFYSKQE